MRAIDVTGPGGPEVLRVVEAEEPQVRPAEVVIQIDAAALNYADILQRRGTYGLQPGAEQRLGLECSGAVVAIGEDVTEFEVGDEVCALTPGGAYAERIAVHSSLVLPVPSVVTPLDAAALPEMTATVWSNLIDIGQLRSGETVLIHGGSGGVGSGAIQIAKAFGARVIATCGSEQKMEECVAFGAELAINYRTDDFVEEVTKFTDGHGADVILDNMGASYFARNVDAAAEDGRILTIGLQGGKIAEINIGTMMGKRLSFFATSLRDRSLRERARIISGVRSDIWPLIENGDLHPVVGRVFPFESVADAHRHSESGDAVGKTLLSLVGA